MLNLPLFRLQKKALPNPAPSAARLRPAQAFWLLAASTLTLMPHLGGLPSWLAALCVVMLLMRGIGVFQGRPPPHRLWMLILALAICVGIFLSFRQFFGKEPGIAALSAFLCLKQLESRTVRDGLSVIFLSFFLQLGFFFQNQSLLTAFWAFSGAWLTLSAWIALHLEGKGLEDKGKDAPDRSMGALLRPIAAHARKPLALSGTLVLQGLPFMIAFFVLFPRLSGPLWGLPTDAYSGMTGLSDSMRPGSISELILSDEIAMRARFEEGAPPPPAQRYWRGPVLLDFDGQMWKQGPDLRLPAPAYAVEGPGYRYSLTLEPHNQNWVLALEHPGPGLLAQYGTDHRLLSTTPLRTRTRLELTAYPNTPIGLQETPFILQRARRLPEAAAPRTRALANPLFEGTTNDAQRLERALDYFRKNAFEYTLSPPLAMGDSTDAFLFENRAGFCEHFSSAFVVLMRLGGVPARVVTGYQGGEINPVDKDLVVRQSDAHAWAEVWLADRGWVRIDPTALSVPSRLEGGLETLFPRIRDGAFGLQATFPWLRQWGYRFDALNNAWNQHVLGYNQRRQDAFLDWLGLGEGIRAKLHTLLAVLGVFLLALLAWVYRPVGRGDPLDRAWQGFCKTLARRSLPRQPWEGPVAYAQRAAHAFPAQAERIHAIGTWYAQLRYGQNAVDKPTIRQFEQAIANWKKEHALKLRFNDRPRLKD
jgi:protein-glutamine gamma-glutamyltransferase